MSSIGNNIDGRRLYESGDYTGALQRFQLAAARDPSNADAYYNMASTFQQMGVQTGEKQYYTQAEDLYRQCLALSPDHVDAHRGLAALLVRTDRSNEAFKLLKDWAKYRPSNVDAHVELARLYEEFGESKLATQYLEHAITVNPNNSRALAALGAIRETQGNTAQALANYQRSYQLNSFQPGVAERIARLQQTVNGRLSTLNSNTRWVNPNVPGQRFR